MAYQSQMGAFDLQNALSFSPQTHRSQIVRERNERNLNNSSSRRESSRKA